MESTDHQLGEKADALFDLAHHFINGENEEKILEYVYPAGLYAMDRYDYDLAVRYLTLIKRILERHLRLKVDSANRALWYQCSKKLGEAMIMTGADETGVALLTSLVFFYDDPRGGVSFCATGRPGFCSSRPKAMWKVAIIQISKQRWANQNTKQLFGPASSDKITASRLKKRILVPR